MTISGGQMEGSKVTVAEGKKGFSRLINQVLDNNEDIVVTKRGKPVAAIIPYHEYEKTRRMTGFNQIMEARKVFSTTTLKADDIYKESKKQLEEPS